MEKVGIAVVGAGYWGTKLCHEYLYLSDVSLRWVADISAGKLDVLKSQIDDDGVKFCTDYTEALKDSEVDAVHVAIPNHLHYEFARRALESGKHVLLEKPMTTSSREAFKLASLSEEKGLVLQVGHIFRFNNALRKVREIMSRGELGKILYSNLAWAMYMAPPDDRDIVFDLAPHPVDVLNYLLDEWPIGLSAIGNSCLRRIAGREDIAFINLEFPDHVLANVYVSWIDHGRKERSVQLVGEKASLECDALNQTVTISTHEEARHETQVQANNTIRDMQLHFIDRIRGRGPQFNSPLIGAATVQVLEAIVHSMKSRSSVSLSFS